MMNLTNRTFDNPCVHGGAQLKKSMGVNVLATFIHFTKTLCHGESAEKSVGIIAMDCGSAQETNSICMFTTDFRCLAKDVRGMSVRCCRHFTTFLPSGRSTAFLYSEQWAA